MVHSSAAPGSSAKASFDPRRTGPGATRACTIAVVLALCALMPMSSLASSPPPLREVRFAARATLYALPLVVMDLTREQMLEYPGVKPNRFVNRPVLANAFSRTVVRPNVDTLYTSAWLDLSEGPMILTLPPDHGRFYVVQCMDAWTNVFADPGTRTLGDRPMKYAIVGPDWHGSLPPGMEGIHAPTRMVWVLARIHVANRDDLAPARRFQSQLDIRPLSRLHDPLFHSIYPRARSRPVKRPPMLTVLKRMGAEAYFDRFRRLERANPPVPPDPRFDSRVLKALGLDRGDSGLAPLNWREKRRVLTAGYALALQMLSRPDRLQSLLRRPQVNGWIMPGTGPQGVFGTHYVARAVVSLLGLAEGLRADALYFKAVVDVDGKQLDGSRRYHLTFLPRQTPPVHAFWSLTAYDDHGYLVANPYDRYGIGSGDPLTGQPDGSLVIYLQPDPPGSAAHRANWIPTPAGYAYQITLRCYWPDTSLLEGHWTPPAVTPAWSERPSAGRPAHAE